MHNLNTNLSKTGLQFLCTLLLVLFSQESILLAQCNPDQDAPIILCDNNLVVSVGGDGTASIPISDLLGSLSDNCDPNDSLTIAYQLDNNPILSDTLITFTCDDIGQHILSYIVKDQAGNESTCITDVLVEDKLRPFLLCPSILDVSLPASGLLALTPEMVVDTAFDNCISFSDLSLSLQLDDSDMQDSILFDCSYIGSYTLTVFATDPNNGSGNCSIDLNVLVGDASCTTINLNGIVFADEDDNCFFDSGEMGLTNWELEVINLITGAKTAIITESDGSFSNQLLVDSSVDPTDIAISLVQVPAAAQACANPILLSIPQGLDNVTVDVPAQLSTDCPLLTVDLATNRLRFCDTAIYHVNYCNLSISSVSNVFTNVNLDQYLSLIDSELPWVQDSDGSYNFFIGDLAPATCGSFSITVQVACTMPVGQTLCSEASIAPSVFCEETDPNWTGASIEVSATCDGDNVTFKIQNVGTGATAGPLEFRIIEDVVMYMQDTFELNPSEIKEIIVPANGATWRLEADQANGHPGVYQPTTWIETCGGFNQTGLVNLFPTNNTDPFQSIHCLEVVNSFDPNDKQGYPLGLGDQHYIQPGQALDYKIRFQNTGTDTAYQVIIIDTLDHNLAPQTIEPGASSHPYRFETDGQQIIKFIFDPIALPDSNVNERASNGFVKFRIQQQSNLALGTPILNRAAIYFDSNAPIITNTTTHTIQEEFITNTTSRLVPRSIQLTCLPNPTNGWVQFEVDHAASGDYFLNIFDITGRIHRAVPFNQSSLQLDLGDLANGIYFYQLSDRQQILANGKLVLTK